MKKLLVFALLALGAASQVGAADPATPTPAFQLAVGVNPVDATLRSALLGEPATNNDFCWITYTACMLNCGYPDPAMFPEDACSEVCFNDYIACG
jgi:hypothetical protein